MSPSHAPESMLINEADPVLASFEQPVQKRIRFPFSIKKVLTTGSVVVLVVALSGAVVTIAVLAHQLSELTIRVNSLDAAFRSGQIGQLASSVSDQDSRIKELKAATDQLAANQPQEIAKLSNELQSTRGVADRASALAGDLQLSVSSTQERVSKIETELTRLTPAVTTPVQPNSDVASPQTKTEKMAPVKREPVTRAQSTSAKKTNRSAGRTAAPATAAPFSLTGIERRGGHTFAVIMPVDATAVSQMQLLSPGDSAAGWLLRSVNGNEAVFTFNGAERRLSIR
ncbi:plasmid transfer protein [Phytobacter diazotrophicus]|uniref:plasmid transfer protein n=1 Tax=Phytobacter diazotrophicus TaxID=395631 RepID=UPI0029073763|nr:plasmid transfer protein [Enterobacteriaceae bacterium]MDU4355633.1 plasmid transfer protein [Phytobacter diazotrophicus]